MQRVLFTGLIFAIAGICAPAPASATPPSMQDVLRVTYAVRELTGVALAPDGTAVAWQERFHDPQQLLHSPRHDAVYVKRVDGGKTVRLTAGMTAGYYDEEDPQFSADGKSIAFLSDARSNGQQQLFVAPASGAPVRRIGRLDGNVQDLSWSPDGRTIALLYIAAAHRKTGALQPGARDVGVIGSLVDEQRLTVVDVATGALRFVTPADSYVYEYGWSPDGRSIAATYAKGNGDNNWWVAKLAVVNVAAGSMRELLAPSFQIDDPQWSPDGKQIAVIGGIMSDFGSTGGDLYLVDAQTGSSRNLTAGAPFSVQSLRWNDASSLNCVAHVSGAMHLLQINAADGKSTTLLGAPESLWSWSSARQGNMVAVVRASFDSPPEVWAGAPQALRQVTQSNRGAVRLYGKAVSLTWSRDGLNVQGWLVYPLEYDASRTYPMVTMIHGGPSAVSVPGFGGRNVSALASRGYFVFMPNPRGSFGEGESFTSADIKDFGYGDWRDDLGGIDTAVSSAPIDPNRLGLMGWSYGGYMAMWVETQTTRFKAIVAGAGIVNWQSYYGQNKIDEWMIPFFGASVYQDPAVYARSSPITFINNSHTPVLILSGERDEEVPAPQSFEFWHAMETLGVPSKLVVYADEGHGFVKTADQVDVLDQTVNWFAKYL